MPKSQHFDYIIVGNGLAGLQLALEFKKHDFFAGKQIALIDSSHKTSNDKTWSFWECGAGQWDHLIYHSWEKAHFRTQSAALLLQLKPYKYKSIRSLDFYEYCKDELANSKNFHFIIDHISSIQDLSPPQVMGSQTIYTANHVFDSRIPKDYYLSKDHTNIIQHFKGIVVKTDEPVFDVNAFTMMDYRIKDGEQTTFTYVLPYTSNKALIEFTYFTSDLVDEETYDHYIDRYIKELLKLGNYEVIETEKGQIPMTDFDFQKFSTPQITKIGTGGGWVKGSTGYSFKHTEKRVAQIAQNIIKSKKPSEGLYEKRFQFYDRIFLRVLKDENEKGEWIFERFYGKNDVTTMFRFLDEESSFSEELKIMYSLFSWSFIKAFFKTL